MIGGNFQTSGRGIESDDLENHFVNRSWCVTDINLTRVPFRYKSSKYFYQKRQFIRYSNFKLPLILDSIFENDFRVLLNSGNWERDTTLRVECLYNTTSCCRKIRLDSEEGVGPANRYQRQLLGSYTATSLRNGRFFYSKDQGKYLIYR